MKQIIRITLATLLTMSVSALYAQQPEKQQKQNNEKPSTEKAEKKIVKKNSDTRAREMRQMGMTTGKTQKMPASTKKMEVSKGRNEGVDPMIAKFFPNAEKVVEEKVWNNVMDKDGTLIGYVVYSSPASDEIKGYAGPTPLLIALDAKKNIIAVRMLPNKETPKFCKTVEDKGLLDSWNGLSIKDAKKKKVDAVSGATFTSNSIIESLHAILEKL